jgi:hypothetical protein
MRTDRRHVLPALLLATLLVALGGCAQGVCRAPRPALAAPCPAVAPEKAEHHASSAPPVREASSFREVTPLVAELRAAHGAENVLVVCDLDDTLLTSTTDLGSSGWFYWQESMPRPGDSDCVVGGDFDALLEAHALLYAVTRMRETEAQTPGFAGTAGTIRELQDAGHPVFVLTSRGPTVNDVTQRELARNGFCLKRTAPVLAKPIVGTEVIASDPDAYPNDLREQLPGLVAKSVKGARAVRYEDGVLLTAGQHKGVMLRLFLERAARTWTHVVYVDDTQKHPERVRQVYPVGGADVHTFHYLQPAIRTGAHIAASPDLQRELAARWRRLRRALESELPHPVVDSRPDTRTATCR